MRAVDTRDVPSDLASGEVVTLAPRGVPVPRIDPRTMRPIAGSRAEFVVTVREDA